MHTGSSTFKCIRASRSNVRRLEGVRRSESKYIIKMVKYPDKVMVRECFSCSMRGTENFIFWQEKTTMNGEDYQEVFWEHLQCFTDILGYKHFL